MMQLTFVKFDELLFHFSRKYISIFSFRYFNIAGGTGRRALIDKVESTKVEAFNALFDEKRAAYVAADWPLDGIFTAC